ILVRAAMILLLISCLFVFLVIGVYETIIHVVSDMNIKILFIAACGIVIGIIFMSKFIHYALKYYRTATFSFLIALVIGSIYKIFPGWSESFGQLFISVIVFAAGLVVAYGLGKIEH